MTTVYFHMLSTILVGDVGLYVTVCMLPVFIMFPLEEAFFATLEGGCAPEGRSLRVSGKCRGLDYSQHEYLTVSRRVRLSFALVVRVLVSEGDNVLQR